MFHHTGQDPTAHDIQQIAQHTLNAIRQRDSLFRRLLSPRDELNREIDECVKLVARVDPTDFSADEFHTLTGAITRVIEALEAFFAKHGEQRDPAQCQFWADAIRSLRESRRWITQGLSPDGSRRPSKDRLMAQRDEAVLAAFQSFNT